jgi:hypothetical protein
MKKFDPQRFRSAVMVIARMRAKKAAVAQLRAQGLKPQHYSAREIGLMADDYFDQHREPLINNAVAVCLTFPEFAGCAELLTFVQTQNPQASMASAVRMLGAQ